MNKRPLPCVLAGFVLGEVWIYQFRGTAAKAAFCLAAILLMIGCVLWKGSFLYMEKAVLFAILIGFIVGGIRQWKWNQEKDSFYQFTLLESCAIEGQVEEKKETENGVSVVLGQLFVEGKKYQGKVVLYLEEEVSFYLGCVMKVKGQISLFSEPTNPGEFNQKAYQEGKGILGCVYEPKVTEVRYGSFLIKDAIMAFREKTAAFLQASMEESQYGIAMAMVLGDKTALAQEQKSLFEAGGISHILAVSGLHMTLIGAGIYKIFRKIGLSYAVSVVASFPCIVAYAMMTGMSSSCLRASIMLLVYLFAEWKGYSYDLTSSLSLAGLMLLWEIPARLFDSGFLLSFGAMVGVGIFYPFMEEMFCIGNWDLKEDSTKNNQKKKRNGIDFKITWRDVKDDLIHSLTQSLLAGIAITVFTLPLSIYFFYGVSLAGLILNLVVIPLMSVLVPLLSFGGIGWIEIYPIRLGQGILFLAGKVIDFYQFLCQIAERIPGAYIRTGYRGIGFFIIYYGSMAVCIIIVLFFYGSKTYKYNRKDNSSKISNSNIRNKRKGYVIMAVWLLFVIVLTIFTGRSDHFLTVLDVGQGDGILFHSASGEVCMIDGGSTSKKKVGQYVIEPALEYYGISKIDYWFVSHMDEDHISGVLEMLEQGYSVQNLILPDLKEKTEAQEELEFLAMKNNTRIFYMSKGERVNLKNSVFYCLHPTSNSKTADTNENSLVLLLAVENQQILLTGDVEKDGEEQMAAYLSKFMRTEERETILKVAHHGSANGTQDGFLAVYSPNTAIVSCGKNNRYGHPAAETIERLKQSGATIYNTAIQGGIEIRCGTKAVYYHYGE